ncbi:unnamed protein product [Caenorhabditis sp. 36 PRJEB53466]|nr:unnamed protein product [Caenorhabditis sp. 36 PRJEB53466]
MSTATERRLFAARRSSNGEGSISVVTLMALDTGERYDVSEEELIKKHNIGLGDFLNLVVSSNEDGKLVKVSHPTTVVEGDVAYVPHIFCNLVSVGEQLVFRSALLPDALCKDALPLGEYVVRISLLPAPVTISSDVVLHFEGTNPIRQQSNQMTVKPEKKVVGAGFEKNDPEKLVVGAGFDAKKSEKLRAVVLSTSVKDDVYTHYLWILEKHAEGRFVSQNHHLQKGHFFEGIFKENALKKWTCQKYESAVETLIAGGLDERDRVWFRVKVDKFRPAGANSKFGGVHAKYIGEIVDGELPSNKLSAACNGKEVKIQRRRVDKGEYVWMVIEIL